MSQGRERKEKICLNCNARTFGPYCHVCGQHNVEPRESAWDLLVHFFNDITHFEGKFITSLRYLLFSPGFLTAEYIQGRRAAYMNPVRMYIFTSAFFFILFFFFYNPSRLVQMGDSIQQLPNELAQQVRDSVLLQAKNKTDSLKIDSFFNTFNIAPSANQFDTVKKPDSSNVQMNLALDFGQAEGYSTMAEYDAAQASLPDSLRDGWITAMISRKFIDLNRRYRYNKAELLEDVLNQFFHSFPKILFISLPLFALLLKVLYFRQRRLYMEHLLFTIHYFVFAFIWLIVLFAGLELKKLLPWDGWGLLLNTWWLLFFYYLYKGLRNFYHQQRGKTMLKFFLLLLSAVLLNLVLFIIFFSYTLFQA